MTRRLVSAFALSLLAATATATACDGPADDPADAGASCERPSYSADCTQVPRFQCGFSARCESGVLKADWHEHVFCDGAEQEEIVDYSCQTTCVSGCAEGPIQDWPQNGAALVAGHCAATIDGGEADAGTGCLFGHDQTCNDDLEVSSYEGTCRSDGTCACNDGFELNPATGKCRWAGDAGACEPPRHPADCCEVASFQCGTSVRCESGRLIVDWHEHFFCGPPPEQIIPFNCATTCPNGCTEGQIVDWPASGQALCEDHCL